MRKTVVSCLLLAGMTAAHAAEKPRYVLWDTQGGKYAYEVIAFTGDIELGKPGLSADGKTMRLANNGFWPCKPVIDGQTTTAPMVLAGGFYLFAVPADGKACS